jgi:site-specific DNA-methyltransferase (adenine-specific)
VNPYYADDHVTLWHGEALAVLAAMPTGSADGLVTDPPYSSGGMVRGDRAQTDVHGKYQRSGDWTTKALHTFTGDSRDQRGYGYWCALWLSECRRILKEGAPVVLFTDWRQLPATTDALQAGGMGWRGIVPWSKPNPRPQAGRFAAQCEYVVWGSSGAMKQDYSQPVLPGFFESSPPRDRVHITQKPLDVMRSLVKIVPEGGLILDPFAGSGTTGVAAVMEGRKFVGVDNSEEHAANAAARIREAVTGVIPGSDQTVLL